MATHGEPASDAISSVIAAQPRTTSSELVEYDAFIESQLRKARTHVRGVDVAASLMLLVTGTLGYFFLAAMLDHWVLPGGLGVGGRALLLAGYVLAVGYFLATVVVPLCIRRINPVYAAQAIERGRPALKNGLVNFLLFRANPRGLNRTVYEMVEEQAATSLAKVQVEATVDRSGLIRVGYALVAILVVCALYTLLSPKNLLQTVGRVMFPWSEIAPPTRTAILEIEPGDAQAFRGQQISVKARVQGLSGDEVVTLRFSTDDRQVVDRTVPMALSADGYKYECVLPGGDSSLEQALRYRITAGDAVSKTYRLEVVTAPTIVVREIRYTYPAYTGLLEQRLEHQSDIKAIEGVEVTIRALANTDIQSAGIDFDCDDKIDRRLTANGQEASGTFRLALKEDRVTSEYTSYQLLFKNIHGQQNPQPVRHQIEVTRDVAPEIQFLAPRQDEIEVAADGAVELEIVANDPDFALRRVKILAATPSGPVLEKLLLDEVWRGQWTKKLRFEPHKLNLKAGDVVEYSAVAEDNKEPLPNRTETGRRRIRVVASPAGGPGAEQLARGGARPGRDPAGVDDEPRGERPGDTADAPDAGEEKPHAEQGKKPPIAQQPADAENPDQGNQPDEEQNSQEDSAQKQPDQNGAARPTDGRDQNQTADGATKSQPETPPVASDGSDDAGAIERVLKHREEHGKKPREEHGKSPETNNQDPQNNPDGQKRNQDSGEQGESAEQGQHDQPGDAQPGEQQNQSGQDQGQKSDDNQGDDQQPGGQQGKQPGGQQGQQGAGASGKGQQGQSGSGEQGTSQQGKSQQGKGQQGKGEQAGQSPGDQNRSAGSKAGSGQPDAQQKNGQQPNAGNGRGAANGQQTPGQPTDEQLPEQMEKGTGNPSGKGKRVEKAPDDRDPADAQAGEGEPNDRQSGGQQSKSQPKGTKPGEKSNSKNDSDKQPGGDARDAQHGENADDAANPDDANQDSAGQGKGAQAQDEAGDQSKRQSPDENQQPEAQGGDGENQKGNSGAGQKSGDPKGSPSQQGKGQPRNKSPKKSPDDKDERGGDDQAQSPSQSDRESNSEGGDDGDRSGGGKAGGGQKANKSGTGGAGENTAADEGAGAANQAGNGEDSQRAGDDRESDQATGRKGARAGKGSSSQPSAGNQNGQDAGGDSQQSPPQPGGTPNGSRPGNGQGSPQTDGRQPPTGKAADGQWQPSPDVGEEANLEYARKATDLALDHLRDQLNRGDPDPELLKQLGWSRKDLENFVRRWEQMRNQAQAPGEQGSQARKELDETLRSLGLRPRATSLKSNQARDDQMRGLRQSRRTTPPPEYSEQYRAYLQGQGQSGK